MNNLPDEILKIDQKYRALHIKTACNPVKIDTNQIRKCKLKI